MRNTHILIAALVLTFMAATTSAQKKPESKTAIKIPPELIALRKEYIKTVEEYKVSLAKLKGIYEQNVIKAEQRLQQSRGLLSEGLISHVEVEQYERALADAKEKIVEADKQLVDADKQMSEALDDAKFEAEYRRSLAERKKERLTRCSRWSLTTYYRETNRSIEASFRFVCAK